MVFEAFELAAFLNKLLVTLLSPCFTAVPVLLRLNLDSVAVLPLPPQARGLGHKCAARGLTFLSLEKQYLKTWILLPVSFVLFCFSRARFLGNSGFK